MNEVLIIGAVLINLTFILGTVYFGRAGLLLASTVNLILVAVFAPKLLTSFGLLSNVGNIFYGSLFLATNLIIERYGRKAGYEAIWFTFSGYILFVVMAQFALRFIGDVQSELQNDAITTLFMATPRIALASVSSFILVQYFNVTLYSFLRERATALWMRHVASIGFSQLLDSVLFFSVAFFGVIPSALLLEAMLAGFALKFAFGVLATPFLYIGASISRHDEYVDRN